MKIPTLETTSTRLRPFKLDDVDALFQIANQRDIFKYFPNPAPWTREKAGKFIQSQLEHWQRHGFGWWGVEAAEHPELVGWNGLQYLPETDEVEVGYLISQTFQGRGWTTEGTIASLRFGFETLGIESIIAIVHPDNIASQRVALKCGLSLVDRNNYFGMDCFRYRIEAKEFMKAV
ncbi:MAG TPA: GNAT family N-acetyltransferase [Anaerolineales bacterium]|nr:GNAT family N-acetyltransferase [Anaerolineales bacterium]